MPKQWIEDINEVQALFERALVGYMAMCRHNEPYAVPLSFVFHNGKIYFHSALTGQKLDYLAANARVCFVVHELDEVYQGTNACNTGIRYHSAMAFGQAQIITDHTHKLEALNLLVAKYSPGRQVTTNDLSRTAVVEIVVERMTGKRNVARQD